MRMLFATRLSEPKRAQRTQRDGGGFPLRKRLFMIAYALFLGIGLPFICLGAIAEPGHPHTAPHFVFAEPANDRLADVAAHALQLATANDATARFYELYLKPIQPDSRPLQQVALPKQDAQPAGSATSSLLLFDVLTLTLLAAWTILRTDRRHCVELISQPFPKSVVVSLPIPPPRLVLCT